MSIESVPELPDYARMFLWNGFAPGQIMPHTPSNVMHWIHKLVFLFSDINFSFRSKTSPCVYLRVPLMYISMFVDSLALTISRVSLRCRAHFVLYPFYVTFVRVVFIKRKWLLRNPWLHWAERTINVIANAWYTYEQTPLQSHGKPCLIVPCRYRCQPFRVMSCSIALKGNHKLDCLLWCEHAFDGSTCT